MRGGAAVRIVQALGWYFPDSVGGTEVYVAALAARLRGAGHEVLVIAPDAHGVDERSYEYEGTAVYRYPIPSSPTRDECQARVAVRGSERFRDRLAAWHPDVVHIHTFVTGLGIHELRAARAAGARVIVTTHSSSLGYLCQRGTMMRWGERLCDGICRPAKCAACALRRPGVPKVAAAAMGVIPPAIGSVTRALPGRLGTALSMADLIAHNWAQQQEVLSLVERFVVLTDAARRAVASNGAPREKLLLNRLGIAWTDVVRKAGPDARPTVRPVALGYLGRFEPVKGVHDLARAFASLSPDVPMRLEFRGPVTSAEERRVERQLREITRDDPRVRFSPSVPSGAVPEVLAGYDVVCCPAVCLEGGPTVALEAHAVGTPVIGTRIGGLAELVTDRVNGRLVGAGDWRALACVLRDVAGDPTGTIDQWRLALPGTRTMDQVAADYLHVYAGRAACGRR